MSYKVSEQRRPLPPGPKGPYSENASRSPIERKVASPANVFKSAGSGRSADSVSSIRNGIDSMSLRGRGVVGLDNMGNTCFMNSILQCLIHTETLKHDCKRIESLKTNPSSRSKGQVIRSFAKLLEKAWSEDSGDVSSALREFRRSIIKFAPSFAGNNQHDSQEFLVFLLEGLHEDVNTVSKKPIYTEDISDDLSVPEKAKESWKRYNSRENSFIIDTFVGLLKSTLTCQVCKYQSVTYDPFFDLSLPIPKKFTSSYSSSCTLQDCLSDFTSIEVLDGYEKPRCARCKKAQTCTKQFTIERFPKILVIHIKRFSVRNRYSKLDTKVNFPLTNLRLKDFASDEQQASGRKFSYDLYGVSNHMGSAISGHYTAYCKSGSDWHCFNDRSTSDLSESRVVSSNAYVLFYQLND